MIRCHEYVDYVESLTHLAYGVHEHSRHVFFSCGTTVLSSAHTKSSPTGETRLRTATWKRNSFRKACSRYVVLYYCLELLMAACINENAPRVDACML